MATTCIPSSQQLGYLCSCSSLGTSLPKWCSSRHMQTTVCPHSSSAASPGLSPSWDSLCSHQYSTFPLMPYLGCDCWFQPKAHQWSSASMLGSSSYSLAGRWQDHCMQYQHCLPASFPLSLHAGCTMKLSRCAVNCAGRHFSIKSLSVRVSPYILQVWCNIVACTWDFSRTIFC